jgi:hypothetical protein
MHRLLMLLVVASACGTPPDDARLRTLEERVRVLETAGLKGAGAIEDDASADLLALEGRLAAVERQLMGAGARGDAADVQPAEAAERRVEVRRERRGRLRELTEEYRARLAAIRLEQSDPAARQAAVREALTWYREQRRAIMAGEGGPAPE